MFHIWSLIVLSTLQSLAYASWEASLGVDSDGILAELEIHARTLNASDQADISIFIQAWESSLVRHRNKKNTRQATKPLLAKVGLPLSPAWNIRRQERPVVCLEDSEGSITTCEPNSFCCRETGDEWCCGDPTNNSECCLGVGGCCINGATCCGSADGGPNSAACCFEGSLCCKPPGKTPSCCEEDQLCDKKNGGCINPVSTKTETETELVTSTSTVTRTRDGTTTREWTHTTRTTVVTVAEDTGTVTTTLTEWDTVTRDPPQTVAPSTESLTNDAIRRGLAGLSLPVPTEVVVLKPTLRPYSFIVRPGEHLDHLARVLQDQGVAIERRATDVRTKTITETNTEWMREVETKMSTEWDTKTETATDTSTIFENAETIITNTVTRTTYVLEPRETDNKEDGEHKLSEATENAKPTETNKDDARDGDDDGGGSNSGVPAATIAGAAAGGGIGLICLVLLGWFLFRRRRRNPESPRVPKLSSSGPTPVAGSNLPYHPDTAQLSVPWQQQNNASSELVGSLPSKSPMPLQSSASQEMESTPVARQAGRLGAGRERYELPAERMAEPPQELYSHNRGS